MNAICLNKTKFVQICFQGFVAVLVLGTNVGISTARLDAQQNVSSFASGLSLPRSNEAEQKPFPKISYRQTENPPATNGETPPQNSQTVNSYGEPYAGPNASAGPNVSVEQPPLQPGQSGRFNPDASEANGQTSNSSTTPNSGATGFDGVPSGQTPSPESPSTSGSNPGNGTPVPTSSVNNSPSNSNASSNSSATPRTTIPETNAFSPYIQIPSGNVVAGIPYSLEELLEGAASAQERYRRIDAYWTLTEKFALFNIYSTQSQHIRSCLSRYPNEAAVPANVLPLLLSTRNLAAQQLKESEIELLKQQYRFISIYRRNKSYLTSQLLENDVALTESEKLKKILPLPTALPTVEPYATRFDEISKKRRLSNIARSLNITIPLQYEIIKSRANETAQTFQYLNSLFMNQQSSADQLFDALEKNTQSKIKFVEAVLTYNRMIAAYVSETVGGNVWGERLFSSMNLRYAPPQRQAKNQTFRQPGEKTEVGWNNRGNLTQNQRSFRPVISETLRSENRLIRGQSPAPASETPPNPKPDETTPPNAADSPASLPANASSATVPAIPSVNSPNAPSSNPPAGGNQNPVVAPSESGTSASSSPEIEATRQNINETTATLFPILSSSSGVGDSQIVEIPTTLAEAVSKTWNNNRRLETVEAYWRLRTLLAELEIEKKIENNARQTFDALDRKQKESGAAITPEIESITKAYLIFLNDATARIAELKIDVRNGQVDLMKKSSGSTENGWPIPTTVPYSGPTYNLESEKNDRANFVLLTESVLIPEKLKAVQDFARLVGKKENIFQPEIIAFSNFQDATLYLKILDNKRRIACSYIEMIESLNLSIARYVSDYSDSFIPNEIFVKSLIGSEQ